MQDAARVGVGHRVADADKRRPAIRAIRAAPPRRAAPLAVGARPPRPGCGRGRSAWCRRAAGPRAGGRTRRLGTMPGCSSWPVTCASRRNRARSRRVGWPARGAAPSAPRRGPGWRRGPARRGRCRRWRAADSGCSARPRPARGPWLPATPLRAATTASARSATGGCRRRPRRRGSCLTGSFVTSAREARTSPLCLASLRLSSFSTSARPSRAEPAALDEQVGQGPFLLCGPGGAGARRTAPGRSGRPARRARRTGGCGRCPQAISERRAASTAAFQGRSDPNALRGREEGRPQRAALREHLQECKEAGFGQVWAVGPALHRAVFQHGAGA